MRRLVGGRATLAGLSCAGWPPWPPRVFDPLNWQQSIFGTLAEHLRLFSRDPQFDPARRAQAAFATLTAWLADGRSTRP